MITIEGRPLSFLGGTLLAQISFGNADERTEDSGPNRTITFGVQAMLWTILLIILAVILPPLAVLLVVGLRGPFWLNILLTLLGYIPGLIHAIWIIARRPYGAVPYRI
jgi:uncharacterized membrane protein YqaE (UPF0057 family)